MNRMELEHKHLYRDLLDELDTIIFICDKNTQQLLYANTQARKLLPAGKNISSCFCFNILSRQESCEHCPRLSLSADSERTDIRYSNPVQRYFRIFYKLISWCGHEACLHFLEDVTEEQLRERLALIEKTKYQQFIHNLLTVTPEVFAAFRLNLSANWCGNGQSPYPMLLEQQKKGTVDGFFECIEQYILDPQELKNFRQRFSREHLLAAFARRETNVEFEYRRLLENNAYHWVRLRFYLIQNPQTGDVEAISNVFDIEEKKKSEALIQQITDTEYDFIALLNIHTQMLEFYSIKSSKKKRLRTLPYEAYRLEMQEKLSLPEEKELFQNMTNFQAILHQLEEQMDCTLTFMQNSQGGTRRKQLKYSYLSGKKDFILLIKNDITAAYHKEQEQITRLHAALAEAKKASEMKSLFLSSVSHDMRTPLNGVLGFTHLAQKTNSLSEIRDYLSKIELSGTLLLNLINDTLELSKIESGKLVFDPEVICAPKLIEHILTPIRTAAEEKQLRLNVSLDMPDTQHIWADQLHLQQIFLNILSNAVKFTPNNGEVSFEIRTEPISPKQVLWHVRIQDSGIGMSPDFLPTIFEPFTQEHSADVPNPTGTGLGLSIVKRLADLMHGNLRVKSRPGEGSTFLLDLPMQLVNAVPAEASAENAQPAFAALCGHHVLLCEDNELNAEIATKLLESHGLEITHADNGQKGLELFAASPMHYFDVILMDVRMPVLGGIEATREIRHLKRRDALSVPILALTANAYEEDVRACLAAGMNAHLAKPLDVRALLQTLAEYIE